VSEFFRHSFVVPMTFGRNGCENSERKNAARYPTFPSLLLWDAPAFGLSNPGFEFSSARSLPNADD
jgi:hypothetical protein